ncbi:NAD(P)-binding protein [Lentithecium fluviatile CBS 122367]|uniref:NAD(P)-binding protein n=1 Tax=Lentithecium fluviatile CBS 122367 TaxID=1168545 RepID=A0A6G1J3K6_9PLEO|nr:NAD(P)-binding protein [Lentithecium fluviatile CBS 122367]
MVTSTLSTAGILTLYTVLLVATYKIYRFCTFYFHVPAHPLQLYKRKGGASWVIISGSSGGIGYALAHQLLSLGFGVIIFAREGVNDAENRLRKDYPLGHIKAFTFNCATASVSDIQSLVNDIKDLPITILINNVGSVAMAHPALRPFANFDANGIDATIALNARFMTQLTRLTLPILQANASPRSLILNLSSAGRVGVPYLSVYCATKAYISAFSASLARECRYFNTPIDCLTIVPAEVHTDGNKYAAASSPTAKQFAADVVGRVDEAVRRKMVECVPYWKHALQDMALGWLPEEVVVRESAKITERMMMLVEKEMKKN